VTGSTGGIGTEIAKLLADGGWNLALVNRSATKSEEQAAELSRAYPGISVNVHVADLLDQTEIVGACNEIADAHPKLEALYNVAGFLSDKRTISPQNIEGHFAINTIAPYLFSKHLVGPLAAGGRTDALSVVVNFGSSAVNSIKTLNVQALVDPAKIGGLMGAYANTKLALTALTLAMNDAAAASSVSYLTVDPGPTKTPMTGSGDGMPWFVRLLAPILFKPVDVQAKRIVDSVQQASRDGESGLYISEGRRKPFPRLAMDRTLQTEVMNLLDEQTNQLELD
ncbi:MAG: SDR family NAD(P)-dependent oxidoreductase, partial [Planctomycetota bacterium]